MEARARAVSVRARWLVVALASLAFSGCGEVVLENNSSGTGSGGNTGSAATTGSAGTTTTTSSGSCMSGCSATLGAAEPLATLEDMYAALEGKWMGCTASLPFAPADAIGIDVGPGSAALKPDGNSVGGTLHFLVQSPSGPVPGTGPAYERAYRVGASDGLQLLVLMQNGAEAGGSFTYYSCPQFLDSQWLDPIKNTKYHASFARP